MVVFGGVRSNRLREWKQASCNSKCDSCSPKNPEDISREADIIISAAGVPNLVRRNWIKRGAIVIDVGTNPIEDPNSEHGYYLTGDVCYEEALQLVSAITPVPGGVGPVTIAMLLSNTLDSAKRAFGLS
ncbi:hypothetical protein HPP92_023971 [Vanilla planifolia]|uniref:Tetrahydrofolate dehydrogenase/cyclohydrolase NAD(P)-binding domain-containing protein n=1 Tax=Vanilla planifolia TaxID=51239 RepID=A0A835PRW6_VANPL|nr:hypothetical protein HPP92_023971 [Vanilla planifolia]